MYFVKRNISFLKLGDALDCWATDIETSNEIVGVARNRNEKEADSEAPLIAETMAALQPHFPNPRNDKAR